MEERNCHAFKNGNGKAEPSECYWMSFIKRNVHLIRLKKAVKLDNKQAMVQLPKYARNV